MSRLELATLLHAKHRYAFEAEEITPHEVYSWLYKQNVQELPIGFSAAEVVRAIKRDLHPNQLKEKSYGQTHTFRCPQGPRKHH